jgi:hypothetical protein
MAEVFNAPPASARNFVQDVLQRLARVKNTAVAQAIGKDESQVSRIVSGESGIKLADLHPFLAALGLKVVDTRRVCVDREVYESFKTIATKALVEPKSLDWDAE